MTQPDRRLYQDLYKNARMVVILKLIFDLGGCATTKQLSEFLDVHHESVTDNIYKLYNHHLVERPRKRGGWLLTKHGFNFLKAEIPPQLSTTITTLIEENKDIKGEVVIINAEKPPQRNKVKAEIPPQQTEVWKAFSEIGITHNSTSDKVANTPGLTYKGVMNKWQELKDQGKGWPGLLLIILPTLSPAEARGHKKDCVCYECYSSQHNKFKQNQETRDRYKEWEQ